MNEYTPTWGLPVPVFYPAGAVGRTRDRAKGRRQIPQFSLRRDARPRACRLQAVHGRLPALVDDTESPVDACPYFC